MPYKNVIVLNLTWKTKFLNDAASDNLLVTLIRAIHFFLDFQKNPKKSKIIPKNPKKIKKNPKKTKKSKKKQKVES